MRDRLTRLTGGLAVWGTVLLATTLLGIAGCDRTRPYAGAAADVTQGGSKTPAPRTGGSTDGGYTFTYTDPGAQTVHVAGSFNDWSTSADPLKKGDGGVWTLTRDLPAGEHQYKFVVNGTDWKPDPGNPDGVDDGFGGENSVITVGGGGMKQLPPPPTKVVSGGQGPATTDGGVVFTYTDPGAQTVHVAGSFNDWSTSADPLTKGDGGVWTLTRDLPDGDHQYKFVVNGTDWKPDPDNPNTADDGFGGENSVISVSAGDTIQPPPPPARAKVGVPSSSPRKTDAGYVFTYSAPDAGTVALAGDFNGWSTSADPLTRGDGGVWTLVKKLPAGSHQYKFVIDGTQWKPDPANPEVADDGFGGTNSVVVVE